MAKNCNLMHVGSNFLYYFNVCVKVRKDGDVRVYRVNVVVDANNDMDAKESVEYQVLNDLPSCDVLGFDAVLRFKIMVEGGLCEQTAKRA
jgi:hypothetical protein